MAQAFKKYSVFSVLTGFIYIFILKCSSCKGQFNLVNALINEFLGRTTTYTREGGLYIGNDCTHSVIKPHFNLREMSHFITCFQEMGRIRVPLTDYGKRVDDMIENNGYLLVTYRNVTSEDGYVQTMFRITGGQKSPPRSGKPAVLLFHGSNSASDMWFLIGEKSLAFILADAGYEVWLINARGTDYSQRHLKYNPKKNLAYWNFSYHEMAKYDMPAYISLALQETGTAKVFFIGYSLGATILPAALAERPELNDKIHCSILYGPGVYFGDMTGLGRMGAILMDFPPQFRGLFIKAVRGRIQIGTSLSRPVGAKFCSATALHCGLCGNAMFAVTGYDFPQMNYTRFPSMLSRVPNTISVKFWYHLAQNYRSCKFAKYDYGMKENLKRYGQTDPPSYNLQNVRSPVYIYYGDSDDFTTVRAIRKFRDTLPQGTVKGFYRINWPRFHHFDFPIAKDADILVYNRILDDLKKYL